MENLTESANKENETQSPIEIIINDKTKQVLMSLIKQRDDIMAQFEHTLCIILDAKDIDYTDKKVDCDFDKNLIKLT